MRIFTVLALAVAKVNSADDSNQSGRGYLRFQLAPGSVSALAPQS